MIRVLVTIAIVGFLLCVLTMSAAVGIAGPEIARTHWHWTPGEEWGVGWTSNSEVTSRPETELTTNSTDGQQTVRQIDWSGLNVLDVNLPADVTYTQASGPAKLTISGPAEAVQDVQVDGGRLSYGDENRDDRLTIALSAPSVTQFALRGDGKLAISNFDKDSLALQLEEASASISGRAKTVSLHISGDGKADLGGLEARDASIDVEGSGTATAAPKDSAQVDISGSGDVTLLTHPAKLQTNISGSGHLHERGPAETASSNR